MAGKVLQNNNSGTWGTFEYGFVRKIPGTLFMAALSAPIGIPFEVAR